MTVVLHNFSVSLGNAESTIFPFTCFLFTHFLFKAVEEYVPLRHLRNFCFDINVVVHSMTETMSLKMLTLIADI
jgi:hypothetical protein